MKTYRAFPLLAGLLAAAAAAQTPSAAPMDLIVLGRSLPLSPGTPAYGSVTIGRERLESVASGRIEGVLGDVAGFQQFRRSDSRSANPSAQGATLRALGGNASSRTLVLLDGVPVADPFFGYVPFNALVPDRLSAVRITRGGGSGAFGAGAVAGTIELASATRADLPRLAAGGFHGSRDATELSTAFSPDLGAGYAALSARWDKGDGFPTTPPGQRTAATVPAAYDGVSVNLRGVAPLSGNVEVQARTTLFRDARTLRFRGADSRSEGQDASLRLVARGAWQVDALAYVQARDFSNVVVSATTLRRTLDQRATPSLGLGGKLEVRPPLGGAHVLRLGADVRRASGTMFEDAYDAAGLVTARRRAGGSQTTAGLFAEDDWTLGRLTLTGGARIDRWTIRDGYFTTAGVATNRFPDRQGEEVSGRAGALVRLTPTLALRAAGYTGFRLPTPNELYRPFTVFPVTTAANAGLDPERLRGAEAGADLAVGGATLGVTLFDNRLRDAIANVTTGLNQRQRRNVGAIAARGVEGTASARHGPLSLDASYAYARSRVRAGGQAFDGLRPAQSPAHSASATLGWSRPGGASVSATLRYVSRQYEDDLGADVLPAALTVDAVAGVPLAAGLRLVGRVENMFDEAVVTRNAAGSTDLGTPRTLWIGLRFAG